MEPIAEQVKEFLKKLPFKSIKKRVWNREYAAGSWEYLQAMDYKEHVAIVQRFGNQGTVLDMGCGSANILKQLDFSKIKRYIGVDISKIAIEQAQKTAESLGLSSEQVTFYESDFFSFKPEEPINLVFCGESITYTPMAKVPSLLQLFREHCKSQDGHFACTLWHKEYYDDYVMLIKKNSQLIEEIEFETEMTKILVCK